MAVMLEKAKMVKKIHGILLLKNKNDDVFCDNENSNRYTLVDIFQKMM